MRCSCGTLIRASQKRCRPCALEFVQAIDTDFMEKVKLDVEDIMTQEDTTKRMNSPQKIAQKDWEAFQKNLRWKAFTRKACVVGIVVVMLVCAYVAWRVVR